MAPEIEEEFLRPPLSPSRKRKRDEILVEELEVDVTAPEPPSKKALRKAKKGKAIPSSTAARSTVPEKHESDSYEELPANSAPAKRSEHGIWIGNLPWTATKPHLRDFLTKDTDITEDMITRIHLPAPSEATTVAPRQRIKPQNKGFAYVDFSKASAVAKALTLSETLLTGRRILIKDSKSFEGRPEKAKEEDPLTTYSGKPPSKRIFLGNLGFDTTKEDLEEHFSRCGEIVDVHVATFEDSGKCKGYAWVDFEEQKAGEAAVRGWVNYEEKEDDDEEDEDDGSEDAKQDKPERKQKSKPRKWWVNKLKGRPLRMEFAEDKAVRYKKRYGKEGTARKDNNITQASTQVSAADTTQSVHERHSTAHQNSAKPKAYPSRKIDARAIKPGAALAAAPRLTGGIVPSLGKKIVFT